MRALVVDDEAPARRRLIRMLLALPDVEIAGQLADGDGLLETVTTRGVDVIFLDIKMPGVDGISLAQGQRDAQAGRLGVKWPPIVFVTAHDEYAVRAFEVAAADYLLKPVRPERLAAAVERVRNSSPTEVPERPACVQRVASAQGSDFALFEPSRITRFRAEQKYTVYQVDGVEHLTEESLSALAQRLAVHGFLRIHRSELVRLDAVKGLHMCDDRHEVELADGQRARVSRRSLAALRRALAGLSGRRRTPV